MGIISRMGSRTYRKSQKQTSTRRSKWLRLRRLLGQSPKSTFSCETVSSRPSSTSSSSESSLRMDTPASSSENPRLAKSSSSPPDHLRSSARRRDESVNSPLLSTSDGATSRARSTSTSSELPTEASPPSPRPKVSDTSFSEASPSDEPPTVFSDSSWNRVPEVAKSSSPVKSEDSEPRHEVRRHRRATRPPPTGSLGSQGQDLKAPRRVRHERTQDAVPRYCADLGAQGGDQPSRTEGQGCPINKEQKLSSFWFPVISRALY